MICAEKSSAAMKLLRVRIDPTGPPPEDFRELDIFPTKQDILEIQKPYLRKNIVDGTYEDTEHYLDVQFRLLREDYIHPLRKGIGDFLDGKNMKTLDVRIYFEVKIDPPILDDEKGRYSTFRETCYCFLRNLKL